MLNITDPVTTTPITSFEALELMEKHGVDFPKDITAQHPELVQELNQFAATNKELEQQINKIENNSWKKTVNSIRMTIENVLVKTVTVAVDIIEAEGRLEGREYAQSIGKLQEFEQSLSDYVKQRDEYIKVGIRGPLNALERWVSNPKKEAINTGKSLGHIAYSIGLKLGELEAAADLAEQGKIAESEKMYDKINSDISTFTKNINDRLSKMSWPEILEAFTELATDFYITGKVINTSIKVFKHAKAHGCSPHDSFNILNSQGLMPISELHPACADFLIKDPKAFGRVAAGTTISTNTVWDKIKPTEGCYKNTKIPRSFELHLENGKNFWVHPNGTKHIYEFFKNKATSFSTPINSQTFLKDFATSVTIAIKDGVKYDTMINVGAWEFRFGAPRESGLLPTIYHALYEPLKKNC